MRRMGLFFRFYSGTPPMIIHVDMDAFYASVEIRDRPELANQPVVVGGISGSRGVVCAASYEARKYGIHSAMPSTEALKRCPHAVFIKPRMDHYSAISKEIREIFGGYTSLVEPLSLDEAFLDVSGSVALFGSAQKIAAEIKSRIRTDLRLSCSAGIAPNKYLAKVASDFEKPDGLVVIQNESMDEFLQDLPIEKIWGIGKQCQQKFSLLGIKTIGQLKRLSVDQLEPLVGKNAQHFWNLARGIDPREVVPDRVAKSISHEKTFPQDVSDWEVLDGWIVELGNQVGQRLRHQEVKARTVQVKMRFSDFQTVSRSTTLSVPSDITAEIVAKAITMLQSEFNQNQKPVRLVGVGMTNLVCREKYQKVLFEQGEKDRQTGLDRVTDQIMEKFGSKAIGGAKIFAKQTPRHIPGDRST